MATHKNLSKDPFEEKTYLELVKTYLKMGRLEDALAECKILARHYGSLGMKDKAARVMALMARINSRTAGPEKEITGLKLPMKSKAPYEKKQNVVEPSHSLGVRFKKKSQREGTHPPVAKASRVDGMSQDIDIILAAKFELGLILKEQGKTQEALDLLGEAITGRSGISQSQRSNQHAGIRINEGGKTPAQFCCFTEFARESQTEKSFGLSKNDQKKGKDRREYYCFYLLCSVLLWILQNQFCFNN